MCSLEKKKILRHKYFKVRELITHRKYKEHMINQRLLDYLNEKKTGLGAYYPTKFEVNIAPSLKKLQHNGNDISLPVVIAKNEPLVFKLWIENQKLILGKYNIYIPDNELIIYPNFLLVPLLAFDVQKYRLGYGGGFYDRTISALNNKDFFSLGIAFDEQETDNLYPEKHDKKLNAILTPTRWIE